MVYIVVGVGVFLAVMSVITYVLYLEPPCEVTEWSRWSPCGKYNFEVMQRMRYVYRLPRRAPRLTVRPARGDEMVLLVLP